ncbi:hypothetical protein IFT48_05200 [Pseudomonas fluorescens]|uniref:hypothetical protein n=1 Tax=Pseudomonas fluorescens TaxID=294 RepID=UPI001930D976|nr:hypothetical protein [Pseudomonas fluorescens]MBD8089373.1 hypothetical protein [Pseudomonas fluorescens]
MTNLQELMQRIDELKGETLTLPLPRRMSLGPILKYRNLFLSQANPFIQFCCEQNDTLAHFIARSRDNSTLQELRSQFKFNDGAFRTMFLVSRHQYNNGPIYTVSEGLNSLLADTKVRENIPIRYFAPPMRNCYIEFAPAEKRSESPFRVEGAGLKAILEGCYLQETSYDALPPMATEARELLELDPHAKTRVLEVGFTASPIGLPGRSSPALLDTIDTLSIYIQDEDEPFGEVLRRHQQLNEHADVIANNGYKDLFQTLQSNTEQLSKILFYLSVEREERRVVNEAADLEKRLKSVADKKKPKIEKMLTRAYDRIIVGPKSYTPIRDRIESMSLPAGTKSPHYRAGYFGIRWMGSGTAKHAELRRVKEAIINEELLKGEKPGARDYEIR